MLEKKNDELIILNQKLTESEAKLKELNSTKDKFFAIISHDIKSPLSAFKSVTKFLSTSFYNLKEEDKFSYIKEIYKSSEHLFNLFQNLLKWAVSKTNTMKFEPREIDISIIVYKTILLLQPTADSRGVAIISELEENTLAYCDINMLSTIFNNLVSNAIKFTNPNGVIKISSDKQENFLQISVSDNGIGIKPDDINKLFRIDIDHKTIGDSKEKGTGLGLILCKEFIDRNGGNIWVESQLDKGSTFYFTLPKTNS